MARQLAPTRSVDRPPEPVPTAPRRDHDPYLIALGLIVVLGVWLPPIGSSLWLDETGAAWVIQGGSVGGVLDRGLHFQGQFPLYHLLLWGWSRVAGTSEIALRLLSVAAALGALWLCFRLALRLFNDVTMARVAACVFVLTPSIAFAAVDARPYAMALATLLGATLALARWLESGRPRDAVAYVVLMALTLWLHYLFALVLVAHVVWTRSELRRRGRRWIRPLAVGAGALVALLLPLVPGFVEVYGRRHAMSLVTEGELEHLLTWTAPPMLVIAVVVGYAIRPDDEVARPRSIEVARNVLVFLGLWLVVPPLTLFAQELVTGVGLYAVRHILSSAPAVALLAAVVLAPLSATRQRIALVTLAALVVFTHAGADHVLGYARTDWRAASQAVGSLSEGRETPILVWTGLAESHDMNLIRDPEWSRILLAPLAAYPVEGSPHPLPYELNDAAKEYVQGIIDDMPPDADRLMLLTAQFGGTYDVWLEERTSRLGFTYRSVGDFGVLRLVLFERPAPGSAAAGA